MYPDPNRASSRAPEFRARLFADKVSPEPPRQLRNREAGSDKRTQPFRIETKRIRDVNKVLDLRHEGRADPSSAQSLAEFVVHLFSDLDGHPKKFRGWAKRRAPSLSLAVVEALIVDAEDGQEPWDAAKVGRLLNLSWTDRHKLKAWHILPYDRSVAALAEDRRINKRERDRERRLKAGAKPRAESAATTKPWDAQGISERTFYRRKRAAENGSVSHSILLKGDRGNLCSKRVILLSNAAVITIPASPAGAPEARPAMEIAA
jgi:hypothetical protein